MHDIAQLLAWLHRYASAFTVKDATNEACRQRKLVSTLLSALHTQQHQRPAPSRTTPDHAHYT
jgi:hypothetical protein